MSDTAQLFILAGVWSLISAALVRFLPNWPARVGVFALLVGVPFWELPYGYYNFRATCHESGGLKIFEPIPPQEIACVDFPLDSAGQGFLNRGFRVVESRNKSGHVYRISKEPTGELTSTQIEGVTSGYCVSQAFVHGLPWRLMRNEMVVVRNSDKQLVARHSEFVWFGMGWQEGAAPLLGRGGDCRSDAFDSVANALLGGVR